MTHFWPGARVASKIMPWRHGTVSDPAENDFRHIEITWDDHWVGCEFPGMLILIENGLDQMLELVPDGP